MKHAATPPNGRHRRTITMIKPEILMMGPYPTWDLDELERNYKVIDSGKPAIRLIFCGKWARRSERLPPAVRSAIDVSHAKASGIRVTNTPHVLTADVADIGVGLLPSVARQIPQADRYVRE